MQINIVLNVIYIGIYTVSATTKNLYVEMVVLAYKLNSKQVSKKKLFSMMNIYQDIFSNHSGTKGAYRRKRACTELFSCFKQITVEVFK